MIEQSNAGHDKLNLIFSKYTVNDDSISPHLVKYVEEPMKIQDKKWATVHDMYVHGIQAYKMVIMYVDTRTAPNPYTNYYVDQLLNVVGKIYNVQTKLINNRVS